LTRDDLCDKLHQDPRTWQVMTVSVQAVDQAAPPDEHPIRRVLVAFDGTPGAWVALERAISIAVAQRARLTIAAVVPEVPMFATFGALVVPYSPDTLRRDAEREMLRLIAAARDEVPADVSLTTQLLHGRPTRALAQLARDGDYDLVVTAPRPAGLLRRLAGASVTRSLLSRTRASVLAVKSS
jgi:nucleotide-binding universal stress UspA family protein